MTDYQPFKLLMTLVLFGSTALFFFIPYQVNTTTYIGQKTTAGVGFEPTCTVRTTAHQAVTFPISVNPPYIHYKLEVYNYE